MSGNHRLERLRHLVRRLEQLPRSEERDRVLAEVRARAVDLDTGETPRAMRSVDSAGLDGGRGRDRRGAHIRVGSEPVNVALASPRKDRRSRSPILSPMPVHAPVPVMGSIAVLAAGERLSLEDTHTPEALLRRAWERGLRG